MDIRIQGAREHNLKNVNVRFSDGLTVVTGVSGSGKTSLVFDTLHHEAHRRLLDVLLQGRSGRARLAPAKAETITGLGPSISVGQNLLNRNPHSTLASASGMHPFLRLLYANYGVRHCLHCGSRLSVLTEDEIVDQLISLSKQEPLSLIAPLLHQVKGSHATLLEVVTSEFGMERLNVDGKKWNGEPLDSIKAHDIELEFGPIHKLTPVRQIREIARKITILSAGAIKVRGKIYSETWVV
ncbi:MAG: hypothetical protein JSW72_04465, partial [Candidatus Bathyarchaeota archaeon]